MRMGFRLANLRNYYVRDPDGQVAAGICSVPYEHILLDRQADDPLHDVGKPLPWRRSAFYPGHGLVLTSKSACAGHSMRSAEVGMVGGETSGFVMCVEWVRLAAEIRACRLLALHQAGRKLPAISQTIMYCGQQRCVGGRHPAVTGPMQHAGVADRSINVCSARCGNGTIKTAWEGGGSNAKARRAVSRAPPEEAGADLERDASYLCGIDRCV